MDVTSLEIYTLFWSFQDFNERKMFSGVEINSKKYLLLFEKSNDVVLFPFFKEIENK